MRKRRGSSPLPGTIKYKPPCKSSVYKGVLILGDVLGDCFRIYIYPLILNICSTLSLFSLEIGSEDLEAGGITTILNTCPPGFASGVLLFNTTEITT